jgi:AcrR family transcriptional regulator
MPRQYLDAHKKRKPISTAEIARQREQSLTHQLAFSTREFAKACRISTAMLYRLWRNGQGPPYKMIGKRRIIERETGLAWLRDVEAM